MADEKLVYMGTNNDFIVDGDDENILGILRFNSSWSSPYDLGTLDDRRGMWLMMTSSCTSGSARGLCARLTVTGGGGGRASSFVLTCEDDTPSHGITAMAAQLDFGDTEGNITGSGYGATAQLEVPDRSLGGTWAGFKAELSAAGTSSTASGGIGSILRLSLVGNGTGKAAIEDTAFLFEVATGTNASGNIVGAAQNEPTWTTNKCIPVRVRLNGVTAYIPCFTV